METKNVNKNVHFEGVKCAICGCDSFFELPKPKTMWGCNGTINGERCKGLICKCDKCDKIYMSNHFINDGHAWVCKTCGSVQSEFTDMNRKLELIRKQSLAYRSIYNSIQNDINKYR